MVRRSLHEHLAAQQWRNAHVKLTRRAVRSRTLKISFLARPFELQQVQAVFQRNAKESFSFLQIAGKPQYIAANRQSGVVEKVCLIVTVRSNSRSGGEPDPPDSPPIPIKDPPPKPQTNPPAPVREPGPTPPAKR